MSRRSHVFSDGTRRNATVINLRDPVVRWRLLRASLEPRAFAVLLVCLSLVFSLFGCVSPVTSTMWDNAMEKKTRGGGIIGCIVDEGTSQQRVRALVAKYTNGYTLNAGRGLIGSTYDEDHFVLIPLEEDGTPVWPFGYRGKQRVFAKIWDDVPSEQKTAILGFAFKDEDFDVAKAAMKSKDFLPLKPIYVEIESQRSPEAYTFSGWLRSPDGTLNCVAPTCVFPYTPVPWPPVLQAIPDDAHIILSPQCPPRPAKARNHAIAIAVISTPATVCRDTIFVPLFILGCWGLPIPIDLGQ